MIDRSAVARALAKAIAHKACNNHGAASHWARQLIELLECADILASVPEERDDVQALLDNPNYVGSRHHY